MGQHLPVCPGVCKTDILKGNGTVFGDFLHFPIGFFRKVEKPVIIFIGLYVIAHVCNDIRVTGKIFRQRRKYGPRQGHKRRKRKLPCLIDPQKKACIYQLTDSGNISLCKMMAEILEIIAFIFPVSAAKPLLKRTNQEIRRLV